MKLFAFILVLGGCLLALPALAATPTRIGSAATGNFAPSTQDTVAFTMPSGSQNTAIKVEIVTGGDNSDPTSVLWGGCSGTALTKLASNPLIVGSWGVSAWILVSPTEQTSTVCANFGSSIRHNIIVTAWENVTQITPLDISGSNSSAASTSNSKTVVTTLDNSMCISLLAISSGATSITDDSGQTTIASITDANLAVDTVLSEEPEPTAGSVSLGYSWTNSRVSNLLITCLKYAAPTAASGVTPGIIIISE